MNTTLNILHLYPKEMNLYGDHGNVKVLQKRCEWRGIKTEIIEHEPGQKIPHDIDIIFGGGGQDSGQGIIEDDLYANAELLKAYVDGGTPTLVICGLYQLFGKYFKTNEGKKIRGISVFDLHTEAGPTRLIGNIVISTPEFGEVVGYENHSGLTQLHKNTSPFGTVIVGAGNNGKDLTEGIKYQNAIGTYLHGPILPKNPRIADYLIQKALIRKAPKSAELKHLNDSIENMAHATARKRPR